MCLFFLQNLQIHEQQTSLGGGKSLRRRSHDSQHTHSRRQTVRVVVSKFVTHRTDCPQASHHRYVGKNDRCLTCTKSFLREKCPVKIGLCFDVVLLDKVGLKLPCYIVARKETHALVFTCTRTRSLQLGFQRRSFCFPFHIICGEPKIVTGVSQVHFSRGLIGVFVSGTLVFCPVHQVLSRCTQVFGLPETSASDQLLEMSVMNSFTQNEER